jgi:hypothetical protein
VDAHEIVDAVIAKPAGEGVWISTFTAAELHERADEIDPTLPLAGVPFAVKDNIDVAGLPTTAACPGFAYRPERHAAVVQRLVDAGAIGRNLDLGRYTQFANLLDMAAVTVPNGFTADGRPASITLFGPAFSEDTLIRSARSLPVDDRITIAVAGLQLAGEPRNGELLDRGGTLVGSARTAPCYRLYHLPSSAPGLVRVAEDGASIDVELWQLPAGQVGRFLTGIRAPLGLGRVALDDGAEVTGFLCEAYAADGAPDITAGGGWRNYRRIGANP